jgi:hypothetical protein
MKIFNIALLLAVLVLFGTWGYAAADCRAGDRYEADGPSGTVTDCRIGLVWLQNANCSYSTPINGVTNSGAGLTWKDAMKWVAGLQTGICGLSDGSFAGDWRLPTKTELMAMVAYARYTHSPAYTNPSLTNDAGTAKWSAGAGSSFANVQSGYYWSSTTYAVNTASAWSVDMWDGLMSSNVKSNDYYVWPVRGGQAASFGSLRIE